MKDKLAIIIPAYKPDFLMQALESISNQTSKDFTLYIGDDASPFNLYAIIKPFENEIPLVYKRFDENLGSKSLVAQWNRCLELAKDENWIWLFSDDDIMEFNCVEEFYSELNETQGFEIYHFDTKIIDKTNTIIETSFFPEILDINSFIKMRFQGKINSFVVDYIFNKEVLFKEGQFQNFDLAWNSDDATWIKIGLSKGIKTILGAHVHWRKSELNISSNKIDETIVRRKMNANLAYYSWLLEKVIDHIDISKEELQNLFHKRYIDKLISKRRVLSYRDVYNLLSQFYTRFMVDSSRMVDFYKVSYHKARTSVSEITGLKI